MNVHASITVGTFTADATVEDCGPDALGDAMRQVLNTTLAVVGADAVKEAAHAKPDTEDE